MTKRQVGRVAGLIFLLAVVGMVGRYWFVIRPRARAFEALQRRVEIWGGHIFPDQPFNETLSRFPPWISSPLVKWLGGNQGMQVGATVPDATKQQLAELLAAPGIHWVNLNGSKNLDDDWLAGIQSTSSMFQISIGGTGVTDRSMPKFLEMQGLASLDLTDTAISDSAVSRLRLLPKLRVLSVGGPNIQAVRLIEGGVFDSLGLPTSISSPTLQVRGLLRVSGLAGPLDIVLIRIRTPSDRPSWRAIPYGWNTRLKQEAKPVREAPDLWSFRVDMSGIPAGPTSVEVWAQQLIGTHSVVSYRLAPFTLDLSPPKTEHESDAVVDPGLPR